MNQIIQEPILFCNTSSTVNLMEPNDFKEINQWCIDEGWNLGLNDSYTYYKIDPQGHFILKNDETIASISLIKHSDSFFTLGPFIVNKKYRHQGAGEVIWNFAMTRMEKEHPDSLIVLYAVSAQVNRYKKSGFKPVLVNQRWYIHSNPTDSSFSSSNCYPLTSELIPKVSLYDKTNYFTNRELIFIDLIKKPEVNALVFMDHNAVKGFGFIRRCVRGYRIGALVAETQEIAQSLLSGLLKFCNEEPVFLDVPECNPHGRACMNVFHAARKPEEDTVTMIKGPQVEQHIKKWEQHYGLLSLEIG
jgi:hypothetical protein